MSLETRVWSCLLLLVWAGAASACAGADSQTSATATSCSPTPVEDSATRPKWANESGIPPEGRHILSNERALVAFPFVETLRVEVRPEGPTNKVLLHLREPAGLIRIRAISDTGVIESTRGVEGTSRRSFPGTFDFDEAGCWKIEVSRTDAVDTFFVTVEQ